MPAIELLNEARDVVGFLHFEGREPIGDGPDERFCIFTRVPPREELFEDPLFDFVETRSNREFKAQKAANSEIPSLTIETPDEWAAVVELQTKCWRVVHPTDGELSGAWQELQPE